MRAYVALGGNLGDVLATFGAALTQLEARAGKVQAVSSAYRTPALVPEGEPAGPDYWNAVVGLDTELGPEALLGVLLDIERGLGRVRRRRWAARTLDLDLLMLGELVRTPDPVLPHPRLHERAFVLLPLSELVPELVVPGLGQTVATLLAALPRAKDEVRERRARWRV
jgi:2-amino-4-hydroxy-6-hydroxymethyldihydropteridine diphosphokinase